MTSIIIDNGSGVIRGGFSTDETPRAVFPSVIGHTREGINHMVTSSDDFKIGHDAQHLRNFLTLHSPVNPNGIITNWDDMLHIWNYMYSTQLHVKPGLFPLVMTESARNPNALREKTVEVVFEELSVPKFMLINRALSVGCFYGVSTGVVVDLGHTSSRVFPIYKNKVISKACNSFDVGGYNICQYLSRILTERGYKLSPNSDSDALYSIIEKLCYFSTDYDSDLKKSIYTTNTEYGDFIESLEKSFMLPDGNSIKVGNERFRCPELYFKPSLEGFSRDITLDYIVGETITQCDSHLQPELRFNIVLAGGNSVFPNLIIRLHKELTAKYGQLFTADETGAKFRIKSKKNRKHAAWCGAAIASGNQSSFEPCWITANHYEEFGASIVHRKLPGHPSHQTSDGH